MVYRFGRESFQTLAGKEIPDYFAAVDVAGRLADDPLRQVLRAAGPGVAAVHDRINDHLCVLLATTENFPVDSGSVSLVRVRQFSSPRCSKAFIMRRPLCRRLFY